MQTLQILQASLDLIPSFLAQAGTMDDSIDEAIGTIRTFALLLAVAAITLAGFFLATGRTEVAIYSILGGLLMGLASVIARAALAIGE